MNLETVCGWGVCSYFAAVDISLKLSCECHEQLLDTLLSFGIWLAEFIRVQSSEYPSVMGSNLEQTKGKWYHLFIPRQTITGSSVELPLQCNNILCNGRQWMNDLLKPKTGKMLLRPLAAAKKWWLSKKLARWLSKKLVQARYLEPTEKDVSGGHFLPC